MHLFYFFRFDGDWITFLIKSLLLCRPPHTIGQRITIIFLNTLSHPLSPFLLKSCQPLSLLISFILASVPQINIEVTEVLDMNIVGAESNPVPVLFRDNMTVVVFEVLFADRAERMFGIGPGENLNRCIGTS